MRILSVLGKILFVFLPLGLFWVFLAMFGIELLVNANVMDPFDEKGNFQSWFKVVIGLLWILGAAGAFFLLSWINRIQKKYLKIPAQVIYAWPVVTALFFSEKLIRGIMLDFAPEKRLVKAMKYYGVKEDMCQALRLGMDEVEVLQVMGRPAISCSPGGPCASVMYCAHSHSCRALDYDSSRKVVQIGCWDGSIQHR